MKSTVVVGVSCNKNLITLVTPLSPNSVESESRTNCCIPKGPMEFETRLVGKISILGFAVSTFLYSVILPFTTGIVTSLGRW